jgi:hypothetical protein
MIADHNKQKLIAAGYRITKMKLPHHQVGWRFRCPGKVSEFYFTEEEAWKFALKYFAKEYKRGILVTRAQFDHDGAATKLWHDVAELYHYKKGELNNNDRLILMNATGRLSFQSLKFK